MLFGIQSLQRLFIFSSLLKPNKLNLNLKKKNLKIFVHATKRTLFES